MGKNGNFPMINYMILILSFWIDEIIINPIIKSKIQPKCSFTSWNQKMVFWKWDEQFIRFKNQLN